MSSAVVGDIKYLDATGLKCPLPVIKAQKVFRMMQPGDQLTVMASDPNAPSDFDDFCRVTGALIISMTHEADIFRIVIQKKV